MLFFADVFSFQKIHSEIEKILITDQLVEKWTYPLIQPKLIEEAKKRGFSLTSAGEYFYAHARGIVEDVEKLRMKTMEIGVEEIEDRGNVL